MRPIRNENLFNNEVFGSNLLPYQKKGKKTKLTKKERNSLLNNNVMGNLRSSFESLSSVQYENNPSNYTRTPTSLKRLPKKKVNMKNELKKKEEMKKHQKLLKKLLGKKKGKLTKKEQENLLNNSVMGNLQ